MPGRIDTVRARDDQGNDMDTRQLFILGASIVASSLIGGVAAGKAQQPYVRVAEIEIDPAQVERYKAAIREEIESSVWLEPGVLSLYAVSDKENPAHVTVFEIYADVDAYKAHLETPHFTKYKAAAQGIVTSLKLRDVVPIILSAKK